MKQLTIKLAPEMFVDFVVYVLIDKHGNQESAIVSDPEEKVQFSILKYPNGSQAYYEDEGHHLKSWAKSGDFEYHEFTRTMIVNWEKKSVRMANKNDLPNLRARN